MNKVSILFALLLAAALGAQNGIPSPESVLGFRPGEDQKLANWSTLLDYYQRLDEASDRIQIEDLGKSTLGKPFIVVVVSSPTNLAKKTELKALQKKLAYGRFADAQDRQRTVSAARGVVYVNCNMHSTEIASSVMVPELLHRYATSNEPAILQMLDECVLVMAPSANPDGIDIVVDWYKKTLGTPWEGSSPPTLYQSYVGHDNNRDWFMLSQIETKLVTKLLYEDWFPAVVYDIHQMGSGGARYFVPPFTDPVNPNLDPLLQRMLGLYGTYMAKELSRAGKTGVAQSVIFDNWWNGGARNVPYRHNMVGILSEAASVRLASPIFQKTTDLKGHGHALPDYKPQTNFPDPWPGGWWRLRDIIDYELISVDAVMGLTAKLREETNDNYAALAERAIQAGENEPPYAWVVRADQRDRSSVWRLLKNLEDTGVQLSLATADFTVAGAPFKKGDWVILAAQAYRAHIKDLLERQSYPEIKASVTGEIIKPYDNAGWTLPLQFGVSVKTATLPFAAQLERVDRLPAKSTANPTTDATLVDAGSNDAFTFINRCMTKGLAVESIDNGFVVRPDSASFAALAVGLSFTHRPYLGDARLIQVNQPRVALYKPWTASMDEGWTRFVLEQHDFKPITLDDAAMRTLDLKATVDVIVIASIGPKSIVHGNDAVEAPPAIQGGLGAEGVENLKQFVEDGGRVICLGASTTFGNQTFDMRFVDAIDADAERISKEEKDARKDLSCPGSILEAHFDGTVCVTSGIEAKWPVFYAQNAVFENAVEGSLATFAKTDTLLSGYLRRPEVVSGKTILAKSRYGSGTVVLFSFRPQNRGQSLGTFRVLFSAILKLW